MSITIKLSDEEAIALWGVVDGAMDAAGCDEEDMSEIERQACRKLLEPITKMMAKRNSTKGEPNNG